MTDEERFFDKISLDIPASSCWIWQAQKDKDGYGRFHYKGKSQSASRVAYQLFVGSIPSGLFVLHICDVRACVKPNHLYLGTQADNIRDRDERAKRRNWNIRGEKHGRAKLTKDQVIEIKKNNSDSDIVLGSQYGVTRSAIYHIRRGYNWKHI